MSNQITTIDQLVYSVQTNFEAVQVDKGIGFAREAEFAIQILGGNDYAMKIAMNNKQSVADAITNISAIGITLNPAEKKAYLVPRKGGICLAISHIGLLHLAIESGSIRWGQARLVYENDVFELNGLDQQPTHKFQPFSKDRGEIVGVYVSVKTADGDYLTEAMSTDEVNAIRDRSDAWKAYKAKGVSCPWLTDWGEMAKKGLALDTPIPTPSGWATMGDLQVGDSVFDKDGMPVSIKAVSEIKHLLCFKVKFQGGEEIICDDEHRWLARAGGSHANRKEYEVMTINQMFNAKNEGLSVTVPMQGALETPEADLTVDPYLLGYWLGDGSTGRAQITCGGVDVDSLKSQIERAGYGLGTITKDQRGASAFCVGVTDGFVVGLRGIGVLDDKHVPAAYLRGSIAQRKQLLAGLLDSDGHLDKARGKVHFYNKNKRLADAVFELAASLGESPTSAIKEMRGFGVETTMHCVQWQPSFNPCINPRKAANYKERKIAKYRAIKSIEIVPTVPTRCIAVTGKSETFLAGLSMVPTHNTVVHRAHKYWPKTERLDKALHYLNNDGGEGISMNKAAPEPERTLDPSEDIAAAYQTKTDAEAIAYWKAQNGKYKTDLKAHEEFKNAVIDHRMNLNAANVTDVEVKE